MGQKVLVFGDIGIDDTLAIIYSYLSDEIDLAGVVADYGNIPRKNAVRTIQYITDLFPTSESQSLQIFAGAEIPMTAEIPTYVTEIHGPFGLGPIIPPLETEEVFNENFYDVVSLIRENLDNLVIVNIGRLTYIGDVVYFIRGFDEAGKSLLHYGRCFLGARECHCRCRSKFPR